MLTVCLFVCVPPVSRLRDAVDVWLDAYNTGLQRVRHSTASLAWDMSVNTTRQSMEKLALYGQDLTFDESPPEAQEIRRLSELLTPLQTRQIGLISDRPRYPENMYFSARSLMVRLERTFSSATVCDQEHCYHAEPDLQTLMETSRDPDRLLWAWTGWRKAVGPPMREVYPQLIDVLNSGARHAGFPDMGAVWRYELEMPNIEQTAAGLYEEIKPLYQQLHALVRAQLRSYYGPQLVSDDGPIPAHLLGKIPTRILMCLERNERDFGVIHHEMGHIQYFMAYRHLPTILRDGANSAFHEAVGDTFFYSIFGPAHLRRLGLIDDDGFSPERSLQLLLQRALAKIPLIGFSLSLDRWRWQVYAGRVAPERYNAAWWQLREQLSGVQHPACTAKQMEAGCNADGMDPGAKFHVADNIPHIRAMLSLGKGRSWQDALEVITGSREISAQPLLRYFQPLHDWLVAENRRTGRPVGWGGQ
ncbi:Angiotensin-converting enzyme [Amphibalanus amphitrite]|uniref:Angiotensin-converting enzyme n=1 Tax=Amphibalanus amphitrite TaxID=1232801 RepID=A0A6A4W857_AMPAM|nr:Angiotensin-converting enzyme [Amphibalanus amphitrite]